jgi:outer membrane protein OmpA-like peptidoglycan-associated protein
MLRPKHVITILVAISLLTTIMVAQDKAKIKLLTPTEKGSTGMFNIFVADTLRQGEFSLTQSAHHINRDPMQIDYNNFLTAFTVGVSDRFEFFAAFETYKRVNPQDITEFKVGQYDSLMPGQLGNGNVGFFNDAPFMDVGFGDGHGDLWVGGKFNIVSERRGSGFGLAVQPKMRASLKSDRKRRLRGLTSGMTDGGVDLIFSKYINGGGTFAANVGFMSGRSIVSDLQNPDFRLPLPEGSLIADRQNALNWGVGYEIPLGSQKVRLITEAVGVDWLGESRTGVDTNNSSIVDFYGGLRVHPAKWVAISGAANFHLLSAKQNPSERWGFYAQASFQRKVNRPPTIACSTDQMTVIQGENATVSISADDSDDDNLAVTFKSSGGRLTQQDDSATLSTADLAPGRYSIAAEVSDGENVASCSVDVDVEKNKMAPTIVCDPSSHSVTMGQSVTLSARASDPNGDDLTYAWAVDGQSVTNNQSSFEFGSAGRSAGQHTVRVTVTDVDGMSASCDFRVSVNLRPNVAPTLTLALSKNQVYAGEVITATAAARDGDNDPITYTWKVDGRDRSETSSEIRINTSGMAGGSHSVAVTVTDDRGGSASDTKTFSVVEKTIIEMAKTKPDNKAKALLDEIALKMQQNPQLMAKITGHTDDRGSEEANERVGLKRAEGVKEYLVEQHSIDPSRIETLSAGETSPIADNTTEEGRKKNRRVEIELMVP